MPIAVWTTIEVNLSVFCACVPAMRPLLRYLPSALRPFEPGETKKDLGSIHHQLWPTTHDNNRNFKRMVTSSVRDSDEAFAPLSIYGPKTLITANPVELDEQVSMHGIQVRQEITWS